MSRKRNHKMARKPLMLHPFERERLRAKWNERGVLAQIHALTGEDAGAIVDKAGTLFMVILGAATMANMSADHPDIRVIRGACNALYEAAGQAEIDAMHRASLEAGVQAVGRLVSARQIPEEQILMATVHAQQALAHGPVTANHFQNLIRSPSDVTDLDAEIDDLLIRWHQHSEGYQLTRGFSRSDSTCREALSNWHYNDRDNGTLEAQEERATMKEVGDAIAEVPNQPTMWRSALYIEARNLCVGASVFSSVRVAKTRAEWEVIRLEARNVLAWRLRERGLLGA